MQEPKKEETNVNKVEVVKCSQQAEHDGSLEFSSFKKPSNPIHATSIISSPSSYINELLRIRNSLWHENDFSNSPSAHINRLLRTASFYNLFHEEHNE